MRNMFCTINSEEDFHRWNGFDIVRANLPDNSRFVTGKSYLWAYKAAYLQYNKDKIIKYAHKEGIPVLLLAGVAVSEAGGNPDRFKAYGVLQLRQLINDNINGDKKSSNATSVGVLAIQLRAAAETLGINPDTLTTTQQLQLANCLLNDDFNLEIVARHLKSLILFDYPWLVSTDNLTDEQMILAGSRYNRGTQRDKRDFINSIHAPIGTPERDYSSYGRSILKKKKTILMIMESGK